MTLIHALLDLPGGLIIAAILAYPLLTLALLALFLTFLLLGARLPKGLLRLFLINLATTCDQAANVMWGGDPDDTISARLGRAYVWGVLVRKTLLYWIFVLPLVKGLHLLDPYHCEKYALADKSEGRRALFGYRKLTPQQWAWLKARAALAG